MAGDRILTIGARGSRLALRQAEIVAEELRRLHPSRRFQIGAVRTQGDREPDVPLNQFGQQGVFVKELESALLRDQIDIAVHSYKDMPTDLTEGLAIAAVPEREDVRDAFISRSGFPLGGLSPGSRVGTGSLRRAAQVRLYRPDIEVVPIRGNVDTRLRKVMDGEVDGVVVAAAGLARLGWLRRATEVLPVEVMLPAAGQGALLLETRADDQEAWEIAALADHLDTRLAVDAERAMLRRLGGWCHVPIAACGNIRNGRLYLQGLVADPHGRSALRDEVEGDAVAAEEVGKLLAERLLEKGADALLALRQG